jgi:hypothetical protein
MKSLLRQQCGRDIARIDVGTAVVWIAHLFGKGETPVSRILKGIGGIMDRNKQQQLTVFGVEIVGLKGEDLLAKKVAFDGLPEPSDDEQDVRLLQRLALEVALQREFGVGNTQTALEGFRSRLRVAVTGMAAVGSRSAITKF